MTQSAATYLLRRMQQDPRLAYLIATRRAYRAHALLSRLCARRRNVSPAVLARASDLHTRLHAALRRVEPLAA